jgi:hypothetical protein
MKNNFVRRQIAGCSARKESFTTGVRGRAGNCDFLLWTGGFLQEVQRRSGAFRPRSILTVENVDLAITG